MKNNMKNNMKDISVGDKIMFIGLSDGGGKFESEIGLHQTITSITDGLIVTVFDGSIRENRFGMNSIYFNSCMLVLLGDELVSYGNDVPVNWDNFNN
jgi:hypothetical protein